MTDEKKDVLDRIKDSTTQRFERDMRMREIAAEDARQRRRQDIAEQIMIAKIAGWAIFPGEKDQELPFFDAGYIAMHTRVAYQAAGDVLDAMERVR